jgi:hypothetical protein
MKEIYLSFKTFFCSIPELAIGIRKDNQVLSHIGNGHKVKKTCH